MEMPAAHDCGISNSITQVVNQPSHVVKFLIGSGDQRMGPHYSTESYIPSYYELLVTVTRVLGWFKFQGQRQQL